MFSLRVLLSLCLIFCQFQPGVAYKSDAYKEKRVFILLISIIPLYTELHPDECYVSFTTTSL